MTTVEEAITDHANHIDEGTGKSQVLNHVVNQLKLDLEMLAAAADNNDLNLKKGLAENDARLKQILEDNDMATKVTIEENDVALKQVIDKKIDQIDSDVKTLH